MNSAQAASLWEPTHSLTKSSERTEWLSTGHNLRGRILQHFCDNVVKDRWRTLQYPVLGVRLGEQPGRLLCVIGQDNAGSGAADADQGFHHHAFPVNPLIPGGGFDHGELTRDLIGSQWQVESVAG